MCRKNSQKVYILQQLSHRSLDWRTSEECLFGETSDISLYRFPWFAKIWYYNGREQIPRAKMKPGYILGYADHFGDKFIYQVLPEAFLKNFSW